MKNKYPKEIEVRGEMFVMGQDTVFNKRAHRLTDLEVKCLAYLLHTKPPGKYTLKQLFGEFWDDVKSKRSFGLRIGRVVDANGVTRLAPRGKNSSKSRVYELLALPVEAANDDSARRAA